MNIRTVLGDIPATELGWCQCHEHLFLEKGKSFAVSPALCLNDEEASVQELTRYAHAGGNALVDAQPLGCGRMAERMERAAQATGVHLVASTGFHKICFFDDESLLQYSEDELARLYRNEIQQGMQSSLCDGKRVLSARAGIIKVAVDAGGVFANEVYTKLFHAAVQAAAQTGVAILAHFEPDTDALELLRLMEQYGLAAERLIACHLDRARLDVGYHKEVAAAGAFLEYDTIHRLKYHDNETELTLIETMLQSGWAQKLLLSLDTTAQRLFSYGGDTGLDYLLSTFRSLMLQRGIGEDMVRIMMVENPQSALALR